MDMSHGASGWRQRSSRDEQGYCVGLMGDSIPLQEGWIGYFSFQGRIKGSRNLDEDCGLTVPVLGGSGS